MSYPDPSAVEEALHIHRTTDIHILSEDEQLRLDRLIYGAARAYVELIGGSPRVVGRGRIGLISVPDRPEGDGE